MPGLVVKPRSRIFHGHDWVYASEIQKTFGNPEAGSVVSLKDFKDRPLGSAIYNPQSQIVARRISRRKQELDREFFKRRIERAAAYREQLGFPEPVYRLAWSEADGLPGVIIDRYRDVFVLQTLTLAMEQRQGLIVEALVDLFGPAAVIERNDSSGRKAEGLEERLGVVYGDWSGSTALTIGGVSFEVDLLAGQKTGLYLDQLDSYAAVARYAKGRRVLDCFCNQGGFALHAAIAGAESVSAVDISESATEATRLNAERNEVSISVETANVFDFLKEAESRGDSFDLIVLDPPSFARNRKSLAGAIRGYKEIHLRALKLLTRDGILSTFSCSHHISEREFLDVIRDASVDAKKTLRLLEVHQQRRDHPIIATLPETHYLKGYTFQLMGGF
ncbi:MAG: class I SAM-dependent rRNA methyltransferase [Verrucomicrobiota bacterium]